MKLLDSSVLLSPQKPSQNATVRIFFPHGSNIGWTSPPPLWGWMSIWGPAEMGNHSCRILSQPCGQTDLSINVYALLLKEVSKNTKTKWESKSTVMSEQVEKNTLEKVSSCVCEANIDISVTEGRHNMADASLLQHQRDLLTLSRFRKIYLFILVNLYPAHSDIYPLMLWPAVGWGTRQGRRERHY